MFCDGLPSVHYSLEITLNAKSLASSFSLDDSNREAANSLCNELTAIKLPRISDLISKIELSMFPETEVQCKVFLNDLLPLKSSLLLIRDKFERLGIEGTPPGKFPKKSSEDEIFEEVSLHVQS